MPDQPSSMHRLTGIVIALIVASLLWAGRSPAPHRELVAEVDAVTEPGADLVRPSIPIIDLDAAECADAGYLCAELDRTGDFRAVRWPDGTRRLRIRVPVPEGVEASRARALQRQAAAGIREWQGRPLALDIVTSAAGGADADVTVRWVQSLDGDRLGQTSIRWGMPSGTPVYEVDDFVLAVRAPGGAPLSPEKVRLTAAHEMGHVLGLPHSEDEADVMYPYNTATRLTFHDFRTIEVLYGLPAGARVVRAVSR